MPAPKSRGLAAGAFKPVVTAVVADFEKQTGHKVTVDNDTAGALVKRISLGLLGNSLAGILGGGLGGQIIGGMLGLPTGGGGALDIGSILGQVASGGAGGGIVMVVIGIIKSLLSRR